MFNESYKYQLSYRQMLILAKAFEQWAIDPKRTPKEAAEIMTWSNGLLHLAKSVGKDWSPPEPEQLTITGFLARHCENQILEIPLNKTKHHKIAFLMGALWAALAWGGLYLLGSALEGMMGSWSFAILAFPGLLASFAPLMGYKWHMQRAIKRHCAECGHQFREEGHGKCCTVCGFTIFHTQAN